MHRIILLTCSIFFWFSIVSEARVIEITITGKESPVFSGAGFGNVGQYEKLTGIAKCEVNPSNPLNNAIVNIDKTHRAQATSIYRRTSGFI